MTGCQSTSLPCVYIAQQSSTRLVALQECNPKVRAFLLLFSIFSPLTFPIFSFHSFIFYSLFAKTQPFPFSSLSSSTPILPETSFPLPSHPLPLVPFSPTTTFLFSFLYQPFLLSLRQASTPFLTHVFLFPFLKFRALSPLTHTPFPLSSSPHLPLRPISVLPPLIPLLPNPNKPGRTFLSGDCKRNTPHVRVGLNINISQSEVLKKNMRYLSSA